MQISNLSYILWRPLGSMENTGHSKQKAIEYIYHICDVSKYVRSVCTIFSEGWSSSISLCFSSSNSPWPRHLLTVHTKQYYTDADHWACFWFYWLLLLKTRNLPVNDPLKLFFAKITPFFSRKRFTKRFKDFFKDLVYILVSYFTLHHGSFSNHRRQTEICLWVILFDILFSTESTLLVYLLPSGLKAGPIKKGDESCFKRIWEKLWGGTLRHYYNDEA